MATSDSPLSVPDITLAVARGADSGGDIAGLTVTALDGSMAHGNRVRIEAEASYAIGPKAQAAPKHWQMGQEIFMEGNAVTAEPLNGGANVTDVWSDTGGSVVVKDSYVRHNFVDRSYLMLGSGQLKTPQPFVGITPAAGKKYYHSYRVYPGERYRFVRIYTIANIVGSFNLDPDRKRGELVDLVSGAQTGTAYITWISGGYVTFEGVSGTTGGLDGGTITGQESGATADLVADVAAPWSVKSFRVEQESATAQGHRWTYSHLSRGWMFHGVRDTTGTQVYTNGGGEYLDVNSEPANNPLEWSLLEFVLDYSGATGDEWIYFNGKLVHETHDIDLSLVSTVAGNRPALIGMDTPGTGTTPKSDVGLMMAIGEFYLDNDTRRLYVCDASTFADSATIELLRPGAWTENSDGSVVIDAYLYQGEHVDLSNKYLALLDGGTVIFEGVAI